MYLWRDSRSLENKCNRNLWPLKGPFGITVQESRTCPGEAAEIQSVLKGAQESGRPLGQPGCQCCQMCWQQDCAEEAYHSFLIVKSLPLGTSLINAFFAYCSQESSARLILRDQMHRKPIQLASKVRACHRNETLELQHLTGQPMSIVQYGVCWTQMKNANSLSSYTHPHP